MAAQGGRSSSATCWPCAPVPAGAVYLPLNTTYTLAELDYFVGDSEPSPVTDPRTGHQDHRREGEARVETFGTDGRDR